MAICLTIGLLLTTVPALAEAADEQLSEREVQLKELEAIDKVYGAIRGFITGFKQGFYKQSNQEINPECFGQDYLVLGYNSYQIIKEIDKLWYKLYEFPLKFYAFAEMIDTECNAEELIYDMWYFCAFHDCSIYTIFQNDSAHLFQITGMLNAAASIVYGHYRVEPEEENHDFYFDMY